MLPFLQEFWAFLRTRKKYWLLPILIMMLLFGVLLVLALAFTFSVGGRPDSRV